MPRISLQQLEDELRSAAVDTSDPPRDAPDDGTRLADAKREIRKLKGELRRAQRRADAWKKRCSFLRGRVALPRSAGVIRLR